MATWYSDLLRVREQGCGYLYNGNQGVKGAKSTISLTGKYGIPEFLKHIYSSGLAWYLNLYLQGNYKETTRKPHTNFYSFIKCSIQKTDLSLIYTEGINENGTQNEYDWMIQEKKVAWQKLPLVAYSQRSHVQP